MYKRIMAAVMLLCLLAGCGSAPENSGDSPQMCIPVERLEEERDFGGFVGQPCDDGARALELVREVLAQYPAGFAQQWGAVRILLVEDLTGTEHFAGGRYAGFTQRVGEEWLMVLDADRCDAGTVHHEIAHILDGILTRAGALTEGEWMEFCPGGFAYGQAGEYPDFFADSYAMTDIREDRARTFEDAVRYGPGIYGDRPALWLKLELFSRAIRAHFDTAGWPEKTLWELALG